MSSENIDLRDSAVNSKYKGLLEEFLVKMEGKEVWVLDSNSEVTEKLVKWADDLESETELDKLRKYDEELLMVLAYIRSRRSLTLLEGLDKRVPGIPVELMNVGITGEADTTVNNKLLRASLIYRKRLAAIHRVDLLNRLFSKDRCEKVKLALMECRQ